MSNEDDIFKGSVEEHFIVGDSFKEHTDEDLSKYYEPIQAPEGTFAERWYKDIDQKVSCPSGLAKLSGLDPKAVHKVFNHYGDDEMFTDILGILEKRSTCSRVKVAALIVKDGRIISTGWNGVPAGHTHCTEVFDCLDKDSEEYLEEHRIFSERNEGHAEQNAIGYAARNGITTDNSTLYVSKSPCSSCAKLIIAAGITTVYYTEMYDRDPYGIKLLEKSNIEVKNINEEQA